MQFPDRANNEVKGWKVIACVNENKRMISLCDICFSLEAPFLGRAKKHHIAKKELFGVKTACYAGP
jgi:hypothetical protein